MIDLSSSTGSRVRTMYRVGDVIASQRNTYPVLLEVMQIEDQGLLRVRGLDWPAGYSAVLTSDEVRYVSSIPSWN
jgi:hypothetical protein